MTDSQAYSDIRPTHVAFVCDGNGRWATEQGLTRTEGHVAGLFHTIDVVRWCLCRSVPVVSAFLWSTENWNRSNDEVAGIMEAADLLIRTGKETRLSNFLLWQSATAWLAFPACYWPDFNEEDLDQALSDWSARTGNHNNQNQGT